MKITNDAVQAIFQQIRCPPSDLHIDEGTQIWVTADGKSANLGRARYIPYSREWLCVGTLGTLIKRGIKNFE